MATPVWAEAAPLVANPVGFGFNATAVDGTLGNIVNLASRLVSDASAAIESAANVTTDSLAVPEAVSISYSPISLDGFPTAPASIPIEDYDITLPEAPSACTGNMPNGV